MADEPVKHLRFVLRNRNSRGVLIGIACALLCWYFNDSVLVRGAEDWALDTCFLVRGERSTTAPIVIIGLDEDSLQEVDKPLMFLSPEVARVVRHVSQEGAAAVGVDFFVPQNTRSAELEDGGDGNAYELAEAIGESSNRVVLPGWLLADEQVLTPLAQWMQAFEVAESLGETHHSWRYLGLVNASVDDDSFWRRQHLMLADSEGEVTPSFALAVYGLARQWDDEWFASLIQSIDGTTPGGPHLEEHPLPLDEEKRLLINYVGPTGTIDMVPFREVLAAADTPGKTQRDWNGAIVLIGFTGVTQRDRHPTPFSNRSSIRMLSSAGLDLSAELMSGIEAHANVIATLHDRAFITTPWWVSTPVLLIVVGAGMGVSLSRLSLEWGLVLTFFHHWAWKAVCIAAFCYAEWRVEMVSMFTLGILVYGTTFALRWRWIRQMMGMVKSEAVARVLEADPAQMDLKGDERELTVLFADVRNFTSFSEQHTPHEVVALLNEYFKIVVPTIEAAGGVVNTYLGDGVMVIFGAPEKQPDHAARAVTSAIEMVRLVHENQHRWKALHAAEFRIGVGVHTGRAVIGTIGSPRRLDYTAIGDTVNAAARIEAGNKEMGTEVLISQATRDAIDEARRNELASDWRPLSLSVKGKEKALQVFAIDVPAVGEQLSGTEQQPETATH